MARSPGPPAVLWRLYFPVAVVDGEEPDPAEDEAHPSRIILYERLRRWVPTSPTFAVLRPEDVIAHDFAIDVAFAHMQQGDNAPFRRSEPLTGDHTCQEVLDALALAAHVHLLEICAPPPDPRHLRSRLRSHRLHVRVLNMSPLTPIQSVKADKIGRLVSVRGSVIRVTPLRPFITSMSFTCPRCEATSTFPMTDGRRAAAQPPLCSRPPSLPRRVARRIRLRSLAPTAACSGTSSRKAARRAAAVPRT